MKSYRPYAPDQSYLLPPSPSVWLPEGHLAYFVLDLVADLDLGEIERRLQAKDHRGERPYSPRMMTALLLYGYAVGVFSSRKLERATFEDVAFRMLAAGEHPHFNEVLLARCWRERDPACEHHLAIEMIDVFGMAGRTVFETCVWIGQFIEAWGAEHYTKVTRHDVKMHLCHTKRSDDAMVRQALIARWGGEAVAIGGKGRGAAKTPCGPLHGVASHAWAALGVAVTWRDARRVGAMIGRTESGGCALVQPRRGAQVERFTIVSGGNRCDTHAAGDPD